MSDFEGHSKEDIVMRAVLSFGPGVRFTAQQVSERLVELKRTNYVSSGTVSRYLTKHEDRYVRLVGKAEVGHNKVNLYEVIT